MIKLYNSYTNTKENFVVKDNKVSLYVCGPTVYNYIHIGNARPAITFDILRRMFEFIGVDINHTSNLTDIDDKIIKQAINEGVSEKEITEKYIKAFNNDMANFNILKPHLQPKVTENLQNIIDVIQKLISDGFAYIQESTGDVYFDVSKSKDYGKLNNINLDELKINAAKRLSDDKSEGNNFVLWKITKKGISFDSPWGKGRPGWHTECMAMISNIYGTKGVDIHGGGMDLKFPHHTNEIAHSEAINNNRLANVWMHNGFLNFGEVKMSKSLGNVVLLKDALDKWGMITLKLLFLSTHYQKPIKYSTSELEQLNIVKTKITKVLTTISNLDIKEEKQEGEFIEAAVNALKDNLNTSNALTQLYLAIKKFNVANREGKPESKNFAREILAITKILGLRY